MPTPRRKVCRRCGRKLRSRPSVGVLLTKNPTLCCRCYSTTKEGKRDRARYQAEAEIQAAKSDSRLKRLYGLSLEDYWTLHAMQNGRCAICRKEEKLVVDHCHKGKIPGARGLLWRACNLAIGILDDDVKKILRALRYLGG